MVANAHELRVICVSNRQYVGGDFFTPTEGGLHNLTVGRTYRAVRERDMLRVWDDFDEDYLYPGDMFQVITEDGRAPE